MSIVPALVRGTARPRRVPRSLPGHRRRVWVGVGVAAAAVAGGLLLVPAVRRVEVEGGSMAPALRPGDRLVVVGRSRWSRLRASGRWPSIGEVVAVRDPRRADRLLVKRVGARRPPRGHGDGGRRRSVEHRQSRLRPVPRSSVVGRAVYRYAPPGRVGTGPWAEEYARVMASAHPDLNRLLDASFLEGIEHDPSRSFAPSGPSARSRRSGSPICGAWPRAGSTSSTPTSTDPLPSPRRTWPSWWWRCPTSSPPTANAPAGRATSPC